MTATTAPAKAPEAWATIERALAEHGDWMSRSEIAAATGVPLRTVRACLTHLRVEGRVQRDGSGTATRYAACGVETPTESVVAGGTDTESRRLRVVARAVRDLVAAAPGRHDERSLLAALHRIDGATGDAIAFACGALLQAERIRLAANGRYWAAPGGGRR